jgi:iron complex outermembrane receptor protein
LDERKELVIKRPFTWCVGWGNATICLLLPSVTFAQVTAPSPAGVAEVERVIITGSNIPTAEEVGPNPVDTYRPEDIQKLGVRTSTDLIQKLPALTGGNLNENVSNGPNGNDGRTEVNLRGLFPKETLVLIDGKRVAPVGLAHPTSVDINLIPFPLVDHIDILKDGASAIYGSDAIAGVFNIMLKHRFRGLEFEASYGNTNLGSSNDAAEREGYILAGSGDDKTDIVVFAQFYDRAAIYSRDRDISSNADQRDWGGGDTRSGNYPGRVGGFPGFVLRPGLDTPTPHFAPDVASDPEYVPLRSLPVKRQFFNFAALTSSISQADRQYFYGAFTRDLCEKYLTVFADFKYVRAFFNPALAPVPFAPDPFKQADGVTPISPNGISVPLQNPFNPFTVANTTLPDGTPVVTGVRYRELSAGPRSFRFTTHDFLFDGGLRGNLGEFGDHFKNWNYEFSLRYNSNDKSAVSNGIVSKPGLREALLDTNPATAFNPFGRNVNTPAALSRVLVTLHETGVATLTDELASFNGDLLKLPAGPISFAAGSEHRKETVSDIPDSLNTTFNTIGAVDLEATRGSRDVWSYFGELRIPVTSPSWNFPGAHSLEFQAAERIEYFSDFGITERPKFSVRYQPFDSSLTLRATYNEAFHAPNLVDLAPSGAEGFAGVLDPAFPKNTEGFIVRELFGGNPNLRPEVAYGFTYGGVWSPKFIKGLTLSADFYHIDLRDRVNFIQEQFIVDTNFTSHGKRFPGQVVRDPITGEITLIRNLTQNISHTITEGIDYEAVYTLDTSIFGGSGFGTFTFTLNGTYMSRYVAAINVGDKELEYSNEDTGFAGYLPHHRIYGSLFYDIGGLDAGVTVHFIGQGSEGPNSASIIPPRKIREWSTVDVIVSYTFHLVAPVENPVPGSAKDGGKTVVTEGSKNKNMMPVSTAEYSPCGWKAWLNGTTITVGMINIFDLDPPFSGGTIENGYEEQSFDEKGRFWYVSIKKGF